jgi:hypothetical protein
MLSPSQLQFRLMTPEAQRAAVQRLALHGWDAQTISAQTGMVEADVQRLLAGTWLANGREPERPLWNRPRARTFELAGAGELAGTGT